MSKNDKDYLPEMLKEEYSTLRSEILQSISKQHQITLYGYGLTALFFGYVVQAKEPPWAMLIVIPFILIAMTSLWTVECIRMVRASYYIGYILWPTIQKVLHILNNVGWETWIRSNKRNASKFRIRQDYLQMFVEVIIPIAVNFVALIISIPVLWVQQGILSIILCFVIIVLWIYLIYQVKQVSNLAAILPEIHDNGI